MKVALHNRVKIYNLTQGKSLPEWAEQTSAGKRKHKTANNNISDAGLELIQDLDFPHFARCLFRTADGSFFFAAGDYPPRLKCFDVKDMSQKFSFNADMPICGGVSLSPDFRRFALRSDNRQITVHNTAHIIDRLRVPHTQRCMAYHENTAQLLSGGNSSEVFRISLDSGAFVESYKTCSEDGINAVESFVGHGLVLTGGDNGVVEAWDPRAPASTPVGTLDVGKLGEVDGGGVTSFAVDDDGGYVFCAGTSTGQVALFDIRLSKPLLVKDHMSELPIVRILFHRDSAMKNSRVISADTRAVKIWERDGGANMTAVEAPNADIYDVMVCKQEHAMVAPHQCPDSGVLLIACDAPRVQVHFIPDLGRAPKWCTFLDSMAESFDENEIATIYDDYKFIGEEEAKTLGITETAISAGKVRPAMHGFFVEVGLYRDLKAVADPGQFARQIEERKQARRQAKMDNRISNYRRVKSADDDDDENEVGANENSIAIKQLAKSLPQDVRPLLKSMTPDTLELLSRDPRFSSKIGKGKFSFDAKNPEFVKLFRQIGEKRQAAAERREKYDRTHFKVVPATSAGVDDDADNRGGDDKKKKQTLEDFDAEEEDHWARTALKESGKRRGRNGAAAAVEGENSQNSNNNNSKNRSTYANMDKRRPNLALLQRSKSAPSRGTTNNTTMLLEAGKNTATTASDATMHKLRKLERHKSKLTLEERLKRGL